MSWLIIRINKYIYRPMSTTRKYRIGVVGTGFIAKGLLHALNDHSQLQVSGVLTRRKPQSIADMPVPHSLITQDIDTLIKESDLIVECTGDTIHGTQVIEAVIREGLPVVTMNPELHIVSGTKLSQKGTVIEAEGDQPGTLAALDIELKDMGFEPIVYGNIKRFLNTNPAREDMEYWSKRQGISLHMVTSFTDGTKVQVEQVLVANNLGATIACRGLSALNCVNFEDGAMRLAEIAESFHQPISDYVVSATAPAGVFIVARHSGKQQPYLEYLKLGGGPHYVITRPYHLCHLEIPKTIMKVLTGSQRYTFNNGRKPVAQVVAVAKKPLSVGEAFTKAVGSFELRGEAVLIENNPQAVPVSLMDNAILKKDIDPGEIISFADVELPPSRALALWQETLKDLGFAHAIKKPAARKRPPTPKRTTTIPEPYFKPSLMYRLSQWLFKVPAGRAA